MEILIVKINPDIHARETGRILGIESQTTLPDKSTKDSQLSDGTHIAIDLSRVKYNLAKMVAIKPQRLMVNDGYGYSNLVELPWEFRMSVKSWPVVVTCEAWANKKADSSEPLKSGIRTIPMLRNGFATQMIPDSRELIIALKKRVVSCLRDPNGRWIQTHYYPDYPESSGVVKSRKGELEVEYHRLRWRGYPYLSALGPKC